MSAPAVRSVLLLALALFALPGGARAEAALGVSYFPGPAIAPVFAGIERGTFARDRLGVSAEPTAGSVAQITAMMAGKYQIAFGALDDGVAYDVGQGAVPLAGKTDFVAVMGTDAGPLHLVTAPDVKRVADLRGRTVAVDARNTGFAFVLYRVLASHGLRPGDYAVLPVGSSQARIAALGEGKAQGAVMFKPAADQLAAKGFHDLLDVRSVLPHYQSATVLVRRSWAARNRDVLVSFLRDYLASVHWMTEPGNAAEAVAIVMRALHIGEPGARAVIAALPRGGDIGRIDPAGVAAAVRLREAYGEPKRRLGDPRLFYDLSYYRAALGH